jgi:hypothetical protein
MTRVRAPARRPTRAGAGIKRKGRCLAPLKGHGNGPDRHSNFEARLIGKTPGFTPWKSRSEPEASISRISGAVLLEQPGPGSLPQGLGP